MRFSIAATLATLTMGAAAAQAAQQASTVVVTDYTTYCPKSSSSIVHGSETYSVSAPGPVTMTGGPYTVTRPLITSTITHCNKCTSSTPVAQSPSSSAAVTPSSIPHYSPSSSSIVVSSSAVPSSSAPAIGTPRPSGAAANPSGSPSGTSPATPVFTGGANRAAVGAGAGLATVFGLVAYLL
ncbi:hypothetical protein ASPWEDRAFT_30728 [Aspergillus wentii DTO 134E9]|uniref:Clock-controlled protein 6 n=1 Tax=Aspergillus wentii DTO 134E9 TaxID=1073089 RepID=A0A1L9RA05_ASPWE|nr:uncharacterized protein ASPWEDRAFT_30728 [Aspergillus wentii DTO 134E9]KAI9927368.1 hypothetical protein MW887_002980 [Aspergillus wentii]OJJ31751.1 hypothetical protein ASPWEDRAFT_30728 [Aspergillus wentii DTO 134E9]